MKNHKELARSYFLEGYNCSQAVLLAFCEELNLDKKTAAMISSSFGGGMARLREVCGSVSGMFMAAGLCFGYDDAKDDGRKKELYALIQELAHRFQERNGSIVCRELLGLDHKKDAPDPSARTLEYYKKRPCADLVADAAEILETMFIERGILS
ncbi:MAG: C-GCAxxG-C-C family protein [Brotaphodocola sp.]